MGGNPKDTKILATRKREQVSHPSEEDERVRTIDP